MANIVDEKIKYASGGSRTRAGKSSTVGRKPGQPFKGDQKRGVGSNVQKTDPGSFINNRRNK